MIPKHLRDPVLKISPSLYSFCVSLRVSIAFLVWFVAMPHKRMVLLVFASSIIAFFIYKQFVNPTSWKNYQRTITIWSFVLWIAYRAGKDWEPWAGLLILIDVLMGQQSWYIANYY